MPDTKEDGLSIEVFKKGLKKDESGSEEPRLYFYVDGRNKDLLNIGYGFHYKKWSKFLEKFRQYGLINFEWNLSYNWNGKLPNRKPTLETDVRNDYIFVKEKKLAANEAMMQTKTRASKFEIENMFDKLFIAFSKEGENWYNDNSDVNVARSDIFFPRWEDLPEKVRWVIIDMNYNGGLDLLYKFKNLKNALKRGDLIAASFECRFKEYEGQGGIITRNNKRSNYILEYLKPSRTNTQYA